MFLGYLLIFTFIFYFYISSRYIPVISWDHINITICMDFTEIIHFVAPTINSSNWPKLLRNWILTPIFFWIISWFFIGYISQLGEVVIGWKLHEGDRTWPSFGRFFLQINNPLRDRPSSCVLIGLIFLKIQIIWRNLLWAKVLGRKCSLMKNFLEMKIMLGYSRN